MATKKTVRGPQLELKLGRKGLKRAAPHRGSTKRTEEGNPFLAIRVPAPVLRAFRKKTGKKGTELLRAYMAKVGGVKLAVSA